MPESARLGFAARQRFLKKHLFRFRSEAPEMNLRIVDLYLNVLLNQLDLVLVLWDANFYSF